MPSATDSFQRTDVFIDARPAPGAVDLATKALLAPTSAGGPAGWQLVGKRMLDVFVALLALAVAVPILLVAAIGVKLSSPGPVLFRQTRLTRGGRLFTMLKLRTFPVDHVDTTLALPVTECPLRWGRLLRRTSIDELPQLVNVVLGHMSLVGPRPERPRFAAQLAADIPGYQERLRTPADITGLAQIRGLWGTTSIAERVAADNEYVDGWSLGRDLRILARTVPTVLRKLR